MKLEKAAVYLKYIMDNLGMREINTFQLVKFIYLIQEWGLNLGFRFGWFIYNPLRFEGPFSIGPYSTQLLYYEDEILGLLQKDINLNTLNEDERNLLDSISSVIKLFFNELKGTRKNLEYILELISSTHFALKYTSKNGNKDDVLKRLTEVKPELRKGDVIKSFEILKALGVLD